MVAPTGVVSRTVTRNTTRCGPLAVTFGATVSAGAASRSPTAWITTTAANSWVFALGGDWDKASAGTVGTSQTLVD